MKTKPTWDEFIIKNKARYRDYYLYDMRNAFHTHDKYIEFLEKENNALRQRLEEAEVIVEEYRYYDFSSLAKSYFKKYKRSVKRD